MQTGENEVMIRKQGEIWFQSKCTKAYTGFQQQALKPRSPTEAINSVLTQALDILFIRNM